MSVMSFECRDCRSLSRFFYKGVSGPVDAVLSGFILGLVKSLVGEGYSTSIILDEPPFLPWIFCSAKSIVIFVSSHKSIIISTENSDFLKKGSGNPLIIPADKNELLAWLENLKTAPKHVFVIHGEKKAATIFSNFVREKTGWDVTVPEYNQTIIVE